MKPGTGKKVVVAMSGGVDSSAAAALLKEDGYDVVGCFMRLGSDHEADLVEACPAPASTAQDSPAKTVPLPQARKHKQGCCSVNDAADARLVAATLGVPFYVLNFKKDFDQIIRYFVSEYNAGRTPNPCVRCNDWLKFGRLHDYAQSIGADFVASGHYAQVDRTDPLRPKLRRGKDSGKDQSYVLFGAAPDRLEHMLLPIGGLEKSVTRQIAQQHNLPTFDKPDSQEICFVPRTGYAKFVEQRTEGGFTPGALVDTAGKPLGEHAGHQRFTHGQRRGLGIATGEPLYVVDRDAETNTVTVGRPEQLRSSRLIASQTNWLIDPPTDWRRGAVQVRYNGSAHDARFRVDGEGNLEVAFDAPVSAVTPGQAAVCYGGHSARPDDPDHDRVLGGGWIDQAG
ncbi:MAG: tRNA 2-thiouridine(34) synthase MnmA [Planctomycetota bacterium]